MESIKREELVGQEKLAAFDNEEEVSLTAPVIMIRILSFLSCQGFMWLILAAKQGHLKRVQKFVAHGVNINAVDKVPRNIICSTFLFLLIILTIFVFIKNGSTALIEAASEGYHEIVNYLINNGANVDQTDKVST